MTFILGTIVGIGITIIAESILVFSLLFKE